MSRTYRNTSTKNGSPKYSKSRRIKQMKPMQLPRPPEPYDVPSSFREKVTKTEVIKYDRWDSCPRSERIYVTKGTPHAREELGEPLLFQPEHSWIPLRYPSRWYLNPPSRIVTRTYTKYIGNPDYDWNEQFKVRDQQWLFDHVRKNQTGARGSSAHRFNKRFKVRALRREGCQIIREELREYFDDFEIEVDDFEIIEDYWDEYNYDEPDFDFDYYDVIYDYNYDY